MNRLTEDQRMSRRIGLSLLGLCLLVGLSGAARAASDDYLMDMQAQSLSPIAQRSASNGPVLICGGQNAHRGAGLLIRGTDVAALWRSAYRMLAPRSALADDSSSPKVGVKEPPHKGPVWGINLSHGDAFLTVQTKW
jgi:hypothetical protein